MAAQIIPRRRNRGTLRPFGGDMDRWLDRWFPDFDELFGRGLAVPEEDMFAMPLDIEEQDGTYLVHAEMPGMSKDDIHVEYHNGVLDIAGEKKTEEKADKKGFRRMERSYGTYHRRVSLPSEVDENNIKGEYKNGVLELSLPIKEPEKRQARKVDIS